MKSKKQMTVLFDANPIAISGRSGVGHYSHYLVQALADAYPDELRLIGHYYDFLGRKHPADLPVAPNISYRPTKLFPGKLTNMLRRLGMPLPLEILAKHRGDVLLFPNFLTLPSLFRAPSVVTIHDLCFLEYPQFVSDLNLHDLRHYVPTSIQHASLILAVSDFTKNAIVDAYGVKPEKIVVTPVPPLKKAMMSAETARKLVAETGISKQFILFVGNLEPRKNLLNLIEAYRLCPPEIRDKHSLVLAGGKGWKNEDLLARVKQLQQAGMDIVLTGYVSDDQKDALQQQASLVVLPSFYEGFGMPILEAFRFGVPVAASDIPVLREVAGDAAAYFNPDDAADIAHAMTSALTDDKLRQRLIGREPAELNKYSWEKTAHTLFAKLREIVHENRH